MTFKMEEEMHNTNMIITTQMEGCGCGAIRDVQDGDSDRILSIQLRCWCAKSQGEGNHSFDGECGDQYQSYQ